MARNGAVFWWKGLLLPDARDWAYARLQLGLEDDPRTADFLAGMLIGYRQEIPADIEQDFRVTGTLHVFAISGQNIAEMGVVVVILLQLGGLVRWRWAWLLAPLVLVYCLLAGSPASAVRATVMALAVLAAWRLGRPLNALGCWSIAFLAMLIWDPRILLDPGAQLSFGVVLGLILLSPPIYPRARALLPARSVSARAPADGGQKARKVALVRSGGTGGRLPRRHAGERADHGAGFLSGHTDLHRGQSAGRAAGRPDHRGRHDQRAGLAGQLFTGGTL